MSLKLDTIGFWSEIKHDILRQYAQAYSRILTAKNFNHVYIDAFAGAGKHFSQRTGQLIAGSPRIALDIVPPFKEYFFIDIDKAKVAELQRIALDRPEVHVFKGDCNEILISEIFPKIEYKEYRRALCLLDPYGLQLDWKVIKTAGEMKTIDVFVNFPLADINRNVLWRNIDGVDETDILRMNTYWGDESWKSIAYTKISSLFGWDMLLKESNRTIAQAFRTRLIEAAGFTYVSKPLPMRNSRDSIIYYLFFASQQQVAQNIIRDIFRKYMRR
jgi:three-Cys-motif partner protein